MVKEYDPVQDLHDKVFALLERNFQQLITDDDEDNISYILYILEEYAIIGMIPTSDFYSISMKVKDFYEMATQITGEIEARIKTACLNLLFTLILLGNEQNLEIFQLIRPIFGQIMGDFIPKISSIDELETQSHLERDNPLNIP